MATKAFNIFNSNERIDHSKVVNQLLSDQHPPLRAKSVPKRPNASSNHSSGQGAKVGVSKSRGTKHNGKVEQKGENVYVSKEDLVIQTDDLKKKVRSLEESNSFLKSENQRLEAEAAKQQRRIDQLLNLSEGAKNIGLSAEIRRDIEKSILVRQLKLQISNMRGDVAAKDAEMEAIRRNTKATHLLELENERDECYIEIQRLQSCLEDSKQELIREKQRREWNNRIPSSDPANDIRKEVARLSSGYQNILTNLSNRMPGSSRPSSAVGDRPKQRPHSATATVSARKRDNFADAARNPYLMDNPYSPDASHGLNKSRDDDENVIATTAAVSTPADVKKVSPARTYVDPLDNFGLAPPDSLEGLATVEPIVKTTAPEAEEVLAASEVEHADSFDSATNADESRPEGLAANTYRPAASKFSVGSRVEGYFGGGPDWFEGTIRSINPDGTFQVRYDDGDEEAYVVQSNLRTPRAALASAAASNNNNFAVPEYHVGQKVESFYYHGTKFYKAVVEAAHPSSTNADEFAYDVLYDDGERELKVPAKNIRKLENGIEPQKAATLSVAAPEAAAKTKATALESIPKSELIKSEVTKESAPKPSTYKVGDAVEGQFKGAASWYNAKITKTTWKDDRYVYNLSYDDGDNETDVPEERIRKLQGQSPTNAAAGATTTALKVNDRVSGYFSDFMNWFPGTVKKVNEDGTYCIAYDDGDEETSVEISRLRLESSAAAEVAATAVVVTAQASEVDGSGCEVQQPIDTTTVAVSSPKKKEQQQLESPTAKAAVPRYTAGSKVQALFDGGTSWFNATVEKVNDKKSKSEFTYELLYDDGDREAKVRESFIKALPQEKSERQKSPARSEKKAKYSVGIKVEGLFQGGAQWYAATVRAVSDKKPGEGEFSYELLYADGDSENHVPESKIRLLEAAPAVSHHTEHNRNNTTLDSFLNEISDDEDDDAAGSGNLNAGPAVTGAVPAGAIVNDADDDMYEDEDFDA